MSGPPGGSAGGAPRLGSMFGHYRIESVVGRGGMGVVVRATDTRLERIVALKFVAPELAGDPIVHARFIRESRLAAAIEHPNIVPIHEAGEADGTLFLAMRAIPGPDLATVLRREAPLDRARTLALATPLADALDAAHRRGLIHRDVKPGNVLLEPGDDGRSERPWLTDFGLTRRLAETAPLTAGGPLGTIDYLAPELIDGGEVGPWTDQYSLACLIVHCLTGAPPWQGPTDAAILYAHVHADRASLLGRVAGDQVAAVLARGLATRAEDRFADCRALVAALAAAMAADPAEAARASDGLPRSAAVAVAVGRDAATEDAATPAADGGVALDRPDVPGTTHVPVAAHVVGQARRRTRWTFVVLSLAAVMGAAALLAATGGTPPTGPGPSESTGPSGAPGSGGLPVGDAGAAGVIVFAGGQGEDLDLWAIRPDGTGLTRLTDDPSMERFPSVAPDGRSIIYTKGPIGARDIWQLPLDGSPALRLTRHAADDHGAAISPDGQRIVWASKRDGTPDIWMMEAGDHGFEDATLVNLTSKPRAAWNHDDIFPAWEPDGTWIVFSSNELDSSDIWTMRPDQPASARALTSDDVLWADGFPTVGPDGTVVFAGRRGHDDNELYRMTPGEPPVMLARYGDHVTAPDFAPDGRRIVAVLGQMDDQVTPIATRLVLMWPSGVRSSALPTGLKIATDPDWVATLAVDLVDPTPSP